MLNPDMNKQAVGVYFSQRRKKYFSSPIIFRNNNALISCQKHLDLVLNSTISFNELINQKIYTYNLQNICEISSGPCKHNL